MDSKDMLDLIKKSEDGTLSLVEMSERLTQSIREQEANKHKVKFYDIVTGGDQAPFWKDFSIVSKTLNFRDRKGRLIGRTKLFDFLRLNGVLISGGHLHNTPKDEHVKAGRFRIVISDNRFFNHTTLISAKGMEYFMNMLHDAGFHQYVPKNKKIKSPLQIECNLFEE